MSNTLRNSSPPEWDRLLSASQKNHPTEIRRLVQEESVDPSHANRIGQSALHVAAVWGHVESVEALVEMGANVDATNQLTGATPLHCTVHSTKGTADQRLECIRLLLEAGANPAIADFHGSIPADYCAERGDDDAALKLLMVQEEELPAVFQASSNVELQTLLEQDSSVVDKRCKGKTLLLCVLDDILKDDDHGMVGGDSKTLLDTLELVLQNGADPTATPTSSRRSRPGEEELEDSPLHRICLALKDAYSSNNSRVPDDKSTRISTLETAAKLLHQHGATVEPKTHQLLLDAARRNQVLLATFLIETLQMSPNVQGRQGMTPLQFAARSGQVDMVRYLLSRTDIDVSIQDDRGKTALDAARANDKQNIVELLEQHINTT